MNHHGSESYYVVGEGLLTESGEGRDETLAAALPAAAPPPPFRFSRMGPDGGGRQLPTPNRRKVAAAMAGGGGGASQIPAGYTYLGQFVDHDLTFDKTNVMLGEGVSPAQLLQARSPSLDLDSLYGAGPTDPASAKFYAARRPPLQARQDVRDRGHPAQAGLRPAARRRAGRWRQKRKAIIPDPRNDENLAVAQTHLAFMRFHNRVLDTLPSSVPQAQRFATAREIVTKHYQWMLRTDYLPRICAPGIVNNVFSSGRKVFEVGAAPTDVPTMPIEFSVAAFRLGHSMIRDDLQLEPGLRRRLRRPLPPVRVLGRERRPRRRAARCRATGSPTSGGSTTSRRPGENDLAVPERKFNRAMRIDTTLTPTLQFVPGFDFSRGQPRVPQPDAGEDGAARDRPADGHVHEEQGREPDEAHERPDPRRQERRRPRAG